jgi:light-regulated signal transduction histidine kinase (bacteriophytochrome)
MMPDRGELGRAYDAALEAYVQRGDEAALSEAYELGRRAVAEGWGVLDIVQLHEQVLETLPGPASPDERRRLATAAGDFFREILSPFEMTFRGFREANDELRRLNAALQRQKDDVEIANRELESFSYSVSHDLRAPLRSIAGFSQVLLEDYADRLDAAGRQYLDRVRDSTVRMGQLIDDLLKLAKVTRSRLAMQDLDLSEIARRVVGRLRAASPERQVEVVVAAGLHGYGDSGLLTVVLENLLGNAWKFTSKSDGARIELGSEPHAQGTAYFVRDNGAGFDMAYASRLFGAFQRLHTAKEFEGTGIGLATVQRVIVRHGGRVWADGKVGQGATFYFTLSAPSDGGEA